MVTEEAKPEQVYRKFDKTEMDLKQIEELKMGVFGRLKMMKSVETLA